MSATCSSVTLPSASNLRSSDSLKSLLRDRAYERAAASRESRGSNADVKNFTASNHRHLPGHSVACRRAAPRKDEP